MPKTDQSGPVTPVGMVTHLVQAVGQPAQMTVLTM